MRRWLWCLMLLGSGPAWSDEDIVDVLRRSQDVRLAALPAVPADSARAHLVQNSYQRLIDALQPARVAELRVIDGPVIAETLHGHVIVVNESLADMPEGVRLFILAHELGHVQMQHWMQTAMLYQKWVPGAVTPATTDPVAAMLGREASGLAHEHEYAADAFAAQAMRVLGRPPEEMLAVFRHLGATPDTPTHPATHKRLASLRAQVAWQADMH